MLNETYILKRIEPFLNAARELSEFEFMELFASGDYPLKLREQYEVINLMITHGIDLVDEKSEEAERINKLRPPQIIMLQQDIRHLVKLKNEQLCLMAKKEDKAALAALLDKNWRFIGQKALQLQTKFASTCLTTDDLIQEGIFGMMEAVKRFDPSMGYTFLTYAWSWVRVKIDRALIDTGYLVKIPVHMFETISRINRYRRDNPTADLAALAQIAEKDGHPYSPDAIRQAIRYGEQYLNVASLNSPVKEDDDGELLHLIPDTNSLSVEDEVTALMLREDIQHVLATLKPKEADIIRMRFGLDGQTYTLEEVGKKYALTRERIRQIEKRALRRMQCARLKSYLIAD